MKYISLLIILFYCSKLVSAQALNEKTLLLPATAEFVDRHYEQPNQLLKIDPNLMHSTVKPVGVFALGIFEGIKYHSALDRFSAIPVFDSRTYRPTSFNDYNNYLQKNYLILTTPSPIIWPDR